MTDQAPFRTSFVGAQRKYCGSEKVIGTFPSDSHEPIIYPIGVTSESKKPDAEAFVKFIQSPKAKELFEAEGFTFLVAPISN